MGASITLTQDLLLSRSTADENYCLVWSGSLDTNGYANISFARSREKYRTQLGHRLSYMLFIGEIPEGLVLDHLCENKACINPWHLEPVTQAENNRRRDIALGKDMTKFPCGHERGGPDTYKKRAGVRKNGNVIYQDVCRPCYLNYARMKNAERKERYAAANRIH